MSVVAGTLRARGAARSLFEIRDVSCLIIDEPVFGSVSVFRCELPYVELYRDRVYLYTA